MIASMRGVVLATAEDSLVVDIGQVGFKVFVTTGTRIKTQLGDKISLHTFLVVREDALSLYGFESEAERDFFVLLLGVNGVGPRSALAILSTLNVETIRRAVFNEQVEVLGRVPGVGKKTAQKILLHLQGKIGTESALERLAGLADVDSEVLEALTGLGYSVVEAQAALQSIPRDTPQEVEVRLRLALKYFTS